MIIEIKDIPNQRIKHLKLDIEFENSEVTTINQEFKTDKKVESWEIPTIEKPRTLTEQEKVDFKLESVGVNIDRPAKVAFNMNEEL